MRVAEKVLVVEDDRDLREVMIEVLRAEGVDAEGVGDADAACALLDGRLFRALLFDPGRPGAALAMLDSVMHRAGALGTSVVLVSGCRKVADRASQLGVAFVRKPFDVGDLIGAVERARGRF